MKSENHKVVLISSECYCIFQNMSVELCDYNQGKLFRAMQRIAQSMTMQVVIVACKIH